ncbi:MAG TPA: hypothetical protein VEY93_10420 [Longimicrobium sp.]|nr:hypothetical protein [Longimicrobium sp.]
MIAPHYPPGPAALAARWREDAQVLRRYGATSRARMLEEMAAELEASTAADATATVALSIAAELSGFTRAHLRRLIREGKLVTAGTEGREPQVRLSDLPRKATAQALAQVAPWSSARAIVAEVVGTGCVLPPRRKNRKVPA